MVCVLGDQQATKASKQSGLETLESLGLLVIRVVERAYLHPRWESYGVLG